MFKPTIKATLKIGSLIAVLGVVLAACGTDAESAAAGELPTLETEAADEAPTEIEAEVEADAETTVLGFRACLRDEGVNVGDPTLNADGSINLQSLCTGDFDPSDPAVQEALDTRSLPPSLPAAEAGAPVSL